MNTMPQDLHDESTDARREVEAHCQSLVDIGKAQWRTNEAGRAELHLEGGEAYLFGDFGLTRLK